MTTKFEKTYREQGIAFYLVINVTKYIHNKGCATWYEITFHFTCRNTLLKAFEIDDGN